ncbi:hypothetical protein AAA799P11_00946 [Marine Group I thaumarchaeote SCGC AAA799-P11]|uniref:Uncharacterized protein n=1 Tax=Marine Group I thaumarchaeote SCGC AAA799-P11 TaxID=1502295 RepID=A0A087RZC1_9ARCH|nr:hypothetical protein AAA799P11_00946 [Marine Group I thaumarchaeote SCGC AAA799-P11]
MLGNEIKSLFEFVKNTKNSFKNSSNQLKFLVEFKLVMEPQNLEEYIMCTYCDNPLLHCHCMCPYCGKRDRCECALFDAATGG